MDQETKFKPGMLVAYGECRQGKMHRVIRLYTVKTVGKRFIRLYDDTDQYRLSGQKVSEVYSDRWIKPLTKALYAQAEDDKATNLGIALGNTLPEE